MQNPSVSSPPPNSPNTPNIPHASQGMLAAARSGISGLLQEKTASEAPDMTRRNTELREYSEVPRPTEVYTIPDVHGDVVALRQSLDAQGLLNAKGDWIGGNKVVQLLGDYIDRGKTNLAVLDFLIKLKKQVEKAGGRIDLMLGNHETQLLGAIRNYGYYREVWLESNGGDMLFNEVKKKFHLSDERAVWDKLGELFMDGGAYTELFESMKLVSQVDDVLYLHAGLDEAWADDLEEKGVEGFNQLWKDAYREFKDGFTRKFGDINEETGPLWIRFSEGLKELSEKQIARIAKALKSRGINAVVVGHDKLDKGLEMHEGFARHGIKLIASDVGMSEGYRGYSAKGAVKIDQQGNIEGLSWKGREQLHEEKQAGSQLVAA